MFPLQAKITDKNGFSNDEQVRATQKGTIELIDLQLDRAWMARSSRASEPDWQARVTTTP